MSSIVLSASVRQNLLSLQATADMLATTQNRLATGNKVNSALDNPTSYFTSQNLNSRASDISNLLDGIGNGVQVLQAANTGITSMQSLISSAQSIANQALQTSTGYSTKSNVSTTIAGATADDLRGTTSYTNTTASSNVLFDGTALGTHAASGTTTLGATASTLTGVVAKAEDNTAFLSGALTLVGTVGAATVFGAPGGAGQPTDGQTMSVNGKTITFRSGAAPTGANVPAGSGVAGNLVTDGNGNSTVYLGTSGAPLATVADLTKAIDLASGEASTVNNPATGAAVITDAAPATFTAGGIMTLNTSTGADLSITGSADLMKGLGLTAATGSGSVTVTAARTTSAASLGALIQDGSTLNVNGKTITFKNAAVPAAANVPTGSGFVGNLVTDGSGNSTVYLKGGNVNDVLKAIDLATGVQTAANAAGVATVTPAAGATVSSIATSGALQLSTGTSADLSISGTGNALAALGLNGNTGSATTFTAARTAVPGSLSGKTMNFSSFMGGTAVNVTFGDGTNGTVKSLADLNNALSADNLTASLDASTGALTISSTNDYASEQLGTAANGGVMTGTAKTSQTWSTAAAPVADATSQATRAGLVSQYNNIMDQIKTTAQDASFNGVNLLNGDQLKMVFNETGSSTLNIQGVTDDPSGLGLANLNSGSAFLDNNSTNKILSVLTAASSQLQTQASTLGSNLSIVQVRQDFSKNMINTLQTGASNLTLADPNQEAANSQALSTRQSIAVSALALANTSQQSVLRLLQ